MYRSMLKSKIHRAVITDANLHYEGSLTLDKDLIEEAELMPFEQVMIYNISNGARFETYIIEGERGSGEVCLNGAAARKGLPGDLIIIASYGWFMENELAKGHTVQIWVDENNKIVKKNHTKWLTKNK